MTESPNIVRHDMTVIPPASPSSPSMRLIMFMNATMYMTVIGYDTHPRSISPPPNGLTMLPITSPPDAAKIAARTCPISFCVGRSDLMSSTSPVAKIIAAPDATSQ